MNISIDHGKCLGCGFCRERLPSIFFLDGYAARLTEKGEKLDDGNEILIKQVSAAIETCPAQTIIVG